MVLSIAVIVPLEKIALERTTQFYIISQKSSVEPRVEGPGENVNFLVFQVNLPVRSA